MTPEVTPGDAAAADKVRRHAAVLPESWVRAGNTLPLVAYNGHRGGYWPAGEGRSHAVIHVPTDGGGTLHEYVHHLQYAMPGLQAVFRQFHRRRTAGEPQIEIPGFGPNVVGRPNRYVIPYQGREYGPDDDPLEVLPVAVQMLFYPIGQEDLLQELTRDDPEMLDLIIGVLFRYDQ